MTNKELDNKINQVLSGWNVPANRSQKEIWTKVNEQIKERDSPIYKRYNWRWIAAASIFAVAIFIGAYNLANVEVASNQEATNFTLPDGSSVLLNAQSTASYNKISWLFNRSVSLSGEAFFKVKKGEKFDVLTENGIVSVLGTSFNVIDRKNTFSVECFTGRVSVNNGLNSTIITKGEFVNQSPNHQLIKETKNQLVAVPQWTTGEYNYKNEHLAIVLNDISTHYNIHIQTNKKIGKLTFTGSWNKTMTLNEVLKIVCLPFELEAKSIADDVYKIQTIK